ncbi:MAG: dihydroorotase [Verrucomicrobiota bacterium]
MNRLILKGGRVLDPASGKDEVTNLYIRDGVLSEPFAEERDVQSMDLNENIWVCPGMIDSMVHLCEPGTSARETVETGTQAAAAGGFTSVINMPGNSPPTDEVHRLIWVQERIRNKAQVNVFPTATISRGMEGKLLAPVGSLFKAGAVALTDHKHCLENNELMRRALEYASMFDIPILDHCRDTSLSSDGVMNEGYWSTVLGLRGWPCIAEEIIVSRNALLAELTGARVHCLQVTTSGSLRVLKEAKDRGVSISCSATPHHLALSDDLLADYDTSYKVSPPLRIESDSEALRKAAKSGVIDFLCSDHSPYCVYEKEVEFDYAPFGGPGLETAVGASLQSLVHQQSMSPMDWVKLWTINPAKYFKLDKGTLGVGAAADVTVINPDCEWVVNPKQFCSKSKISPFAGRALKGRAIYTIVNGNVVWQSSDKDRNE